MKVARSESYPAILPGKSFIYRYITPISILSFGVAAIMALGLQLHLQQNGDGNPTPPFKLNDTDASLKDNTTEIQTPCFYERVSVLPNPLLQTQNFNVLEFKNETYHSSDPVCTYWDFLIHLPANPSIASSSSSPLEKAFESTLEQLSKLAESQVYPISTSNNPTAEKTDLIIQQFRYGWTIVAAIPPLVLAGWVMRPVISEIFNQCKLVAFLLRSLVIGRYFN